MSIHPALEERETGDELYGAKGLYGAGFLEHSIRTDFRDLCRLIGRENARAEVAEIINAEFERTAQS
jgi:hypothetical protein